MKITRGPGLKPAFQPYTLTLVIESLDEHKAFEQAFGFDYSLSHAAFETCSLTEEQRVILQDFFGDAWTQMTNSTA